MKFIFLYLFIVFATCSCTSNSTDKVNDLLKLDSTLQGYSSLEEFTSLCVSRKSINRISVCDSIHGKCQAGEVYYSSVLDGIGVPVTTFDSISSKMCEIGFKTFYRYKDYSIWVEDGAFGDIYGYLINHNPGVSEVKSFELDKKYHVGVGTKVRENVYYFSSGVK